MIFLVALLAIIFESVRFWKLLKARKYWRKIGSKSLFALDVIVLALIVAQLTHSDFGRMPFLEGTVASVLSWIGVIVMFFGTAFSTWARVYMGSSWMTGWDAYGPISLITDGPWKFVRHPIYAGTWFFGVGFELALFNYLVIPAVCSIIILLYVAKKEELDLAGMFKIKWLRYKARTRYYFIPYIF